MNAVFESSSTVAEAAPIEGSTTTGTARPRSRTCRALSGWHPSAPSHWIVNSCVVSDAVKNPTRDAPYRQGSVGLWFSTWDRVPMGFGSVPSTETVMVSVYWLWETSWTR